jgi:UDP-glucose 4-epimerase
VLEAMRKNDIKEIMFSSTSTVYGQVDRSNGPTPENYSPLSPISMYGASKLAAEAFIVAHHHMYDVVIWIFRFANVVGSRGTHGVVKDFISKLRKNARSMEILGNGKQEKPYIHVDDCVKGILYGMNHAPRKAQVFNLGNADTITVDQIANIVVREMGLSSVEFVYTGGDKGWPGDVPYVLLDTAKMRSIGFVPRLNSVGAVTQAVREMVGANDASLLGFARESN